MVTGSRKSSFLPILTMVVSLIGARAGAHIISIDNSMEITADRDKASAQLMVPILAMCDWTAALEGRFRPDKPDDHLAYAKAQADKIVSSLQLNYDDVEMQGKVTETSLRTVDLGLTEDMAPQEMAVYTIEFTPARKIVAPPKEISFSHNLLAMPEQFQQMDVTILCMLHLHLAGQTAVKSDAVATDDRATFKCKWPTAPTSAPAHAMTSPATGPAVSAALIVPETAKASSTEMYMLYGAITLAVAAGAGLGSIFLKHRAR